MTAPNPPASELAWKYACNLLQQGKKKKKKWKKNKKHSSFGVGLISEQDSWGRKSHLSNVVFKRPGLTFISVYLLPCSAASEVLCNINSICPGIFSLSLAEITLVAVMHPFSVISRWSSAVLLPFGACVTLLLIQTGPGRQLIRRGGGQPCSANLHSR